MPALDVAVVQLELPSVGGPDVDGDVEFTHIDHGRIPSLGDLVGVLLEQPHIVHEEEDGPEARVGDSGGVMQESVSGLPDHIEVPFDADGLRHPVVVDVLLEEDLGRVVVPLGVRFPQLTHQILLPGVGVHVVYDGVVRGDLDILEKCKFIETHVITLT